MSDIKRVVLAYSGGLDTSVIAKWLEVERGCEVVTFTADLGQGDDPVQQGGDLPVVLRVEQARELANFVLAGDRPVTLTTFRDVAWNAPFYAAMGFEILPDSALSDRLRKILRDEGAHGIPIERRVAMRWTKPQTTTT